MNVCLLITAVMKFVLSVIQPVSAPAAYSVDELWVVLMCILFIVTSIYNVIFRRVMEEGEA